MLKSLTVSNFALVDALEIHLGPGLTVITGESGAGKSILLAALSLVLGERAASDTIRPGAERAEVSAEFDVSAIETAMAYLEEQALEDPEEPGRVLVRRVVSRDGRSRAYLNGTPVNLGVLRTLTAGLIDIHGQDDNVRLADGQVQRALLDGYGVSRKLLADCRAAYRAWQQASAEHAELEASVRSSEDRAALLRYQLEELDTAAPAPGEFEGIEQQHKRLSQSRELKSAVADVLMLLEGADPYAEAQSSLARLDDDHEALRAARDTLLTISDLAADATRDLRSYDDSLSDDPEALRELDARLELLHELARKHRVQPEALPEHLSALTSELESLSSDRGALTELEEAKVRFEKAYRKHAAALTKARRKAADGFCQAVSEHMRTLGIKGGALAIEFHPQESETGAEAVEYQCVTNPRYPAAPLSRIASGGERARISLAIQIVAAAKNQLPSLILDEADVGVGGTTADTVGRLLRGLAGHTQ
ncbi:MAG: DNA repair protein RecN, partial [Pseudomonadota bacterium]